jgi:hypothetical protein
MDVGLARCQIEPEPEPEHEPEPSPPYGVLGGRILGQWAVEVPVPVPAASA